MEWAEFSWALGAFFASHVIPVRFGGALTARLSRRVYLAGYSLLSLGLLYWLIVAAGRAPFVELWQQAGWMRWLVNLAMPLAVLAACLGGMVGLMAGFALWGGTHLLANGDLAHVILFGLLLGYALFGLVISTRRGIALRRDWRRCVAALLIWVALFHLHPLVIGVNPLP